MKHIKQISVAKAQGGIFGNLFGSIEELIRSVLCAIKEILGIEDESCVED